MAFQKAWRPGTSTPPGILDKVKPAEHGVIVRTAAQDVTAEEIERDVRRLLDQWQQINEESLRQRKPPACCSENLN